MPRVLYFVYSEGFQGDGQKTSLIGPLSVFTPIFVPGNFSFAISFSIQGLEMNRDHDLQVKFLTPDQNDAPVIDSQSITINVQSPDAKNRIPERHHAMSINMEFRNVIFRREGEYNTEILLNGDRLGLFPIPVYGLEAL